MQISAKAAGVTQVNLWGEDKTLYTIDVIVYADAQALSVLLRSQFPTASLRVIPVSKGVLIWGYVDRAEDVGLIQRIAEEYYPKKVINAVTVAGVQQVLLKVRVMEVSRTKLRRLGFDFAKLTRHQFGHLGHQRPADAHRQRRRQQHRQRDVLLRRGRRRQRLPRRVGRPAPGQSGQDHGRARA